MYKLILVEEGKKEELAKGSLETLISFLKENEGIYNWVQDEDPEMELPVLESIETVRELEAELKKVDLDWWSLEVVE